MGKYGSGVKMKDVITCECKEVEEILLRSGMDRAAQKKVMDALKEMAYQWCMANAGACAIDECARKGLDKKTYTEMMNPANFGSIIEKKMKETWPF